MEELFLKPTKIFKKNSTFNCYCAFIKTRDLVKE